jgi:lysophospholipase L1-like esterase
MEAGCSAAARRGLLNAQFASMNLGNMGEKAQNAAAAYGFARRSTLIETCDYAIVMYGTNDVAAGRTLSQMQADLTAIWSQLVDRDLAVYAATIPPIITGSWATEGGQTVTANEAARVALNDWIRSTPAPLAGYFETADTVETTRNSGKWKSPGYTADGTHPSATGHAAMAGAVTTSVLV